MRKELFRRACLEQLKPDIDGELVQAVKTCQEEGRLSTYGNIVREILVSQSDNYEFRIRFSRLFRTNEEAVFRYLKEQQSNFGILLFSEEVEKHLEIEPGAPTTRLFREDFSYLLTCHLPHTYQRVLSAQIKPVFQRLDICERGIVGVVDIDSFPIVVKHTLSDEETEIAKQLGEKGLAPQVYEATPEMIAEEYIPDPPVQKFAQNPSFVGDCIGRILRAVHQEGIVYDDNLMGHILVRTPPEFEVRLIDLSSAFRGKEFEKDWEQAKRELGKIYEKNQKGLRKASLALEKWREK